MREIKFIAGEIYHIYNRGVEKRNVFLEDKDMWRFLQGLFLFNNEEKASKTLWALENRGEGLNMKTLKNLLDNEERTPLVRIMADCLMPNHYHLIVQEITKGGISKFMQKLGLGYTNYFNKKNNKRVGSLFQGPFKAVHIDNELYLQYLLIYINVINPGQLIEPDLKQKGIKNIDKIMKFAAEYPWSTHPEYLQTRNSFIINKGVLGELFPDPNKYREFAEMVLRDKKYQQIAKLTLD